jgi:hypothetical protein
MDTVTILAFAITVVFFVSFVPYFIISFLNAARPNLGRTLRGAKLIAYNVFVCAPYLNAVVNPFIYGALNTAFRAECVKVWQSVTCRRQLPRPQSASADPATSTTDVSE